MLTYLHISYDYRIDSNIRAFSNGNLLTSLYNSLINHWNIYVAVFMVTIGYVHVWREKDFLSNFQRVGNRNSASLTNFRAPANSYCTPPVKIRTFAASATINPTLAAFTLLKVGVTRKMKNNAYRYQYGAVG